MAESKEAWAVIVNSDLIEGRGRNFVKHICEIKATARRLAHKADVQGSNGLVERVLLKKFDGRWCGPVDVVSPTDQDKKDQLVIDARAEAEERALSLGLSDDDLRAIRAT